jgi:hypothetical protein
MRLRFTIRDLLWFTAVAALAAQTMKSSVVLPPSVVVVVAILLLLVAIVGVSRNPRIRRLANYRLVLVSTEHNDQFWLSLKNLASAIGDSRQHAENAWQRYGQDYLVLTSSEQAEVREQITTSIDGLTQLEARLAGNETF